MAEKEMNILQKLAKIRKQVEVVQKNKSGYGYKYVTDDELLSKITVGMDKYGVSLLPGIAPGTLNVQPYRYEKTKKEKMRDGSFSTYTENVNEVLVNCDMQYTWVNNDKPEERIVVPWGMVGHQADGSQSFGSGLTYSMRYFLLKYFSVATPDDDPDNWRSKQREAERAEDLEIAKNTISIFDNNVKEYLERHPENAEKVKELVVRIAKKSNYFSVTDSQTAIRLLEAFQEKFIEEDK